MNSGLDENSANESDSRVVFRRLLLAKQLFLHGLDHAERLGQLNKMIAVHNFHNAIEVTLRCILIKYEIRAEKQINVEFEVMLNEIDKYPPFRDKGIKLPYRQEIRNLNQMRNWVQHHAVEPESSTMDYWKVFTRLALETICETYFKVKIQTLTPLDLVANMELRNLLSLAFSVLERGQPRNALIISTIAYKMAENGILGTMGEPALPFVPDLTSGHRDYWDDQGEDDSRWDEVSQALKALNTKLEEVSTLCGLTSSGINLSERKRLRSSMPRVVFAMNGHPHVQMVDLPVEEEEARWVLEFVLNIIIDWQSLGLNPIVPEWGSESARKLVESGDIENSGSVTVLLARPFGG